MNKRTRLGLLIINLLTIGFFINSVYTFNQRQNIIKQNKKLDSQEYKVIELKCKNGRNSHSIVRIKYKNKEYSIPILYKECREWSQHKLPPSFYVNIKNDKIFTQSNLTYRMIITGGVLVLFFLSFWNPKVYNLLNKK